MKTALTLVWIASIVTAFEFGVYFRGARSAPEHQSVGSSGHSGALSDDNGGVSRRPDAGNASLGNYRSLYEMSEWLPSADEAAVEEKIRRLKAMPWTPNVDRLLAMLYQRWGEIAPLSAMKSIASLPRSVREQNEANILRGWAGVKPAEAWSWVAGEQSSKNSDLTKNRFRNLVAGCVEQGNFGDAASLISGQKDRDGVQQVTAKLLGEAWAKNDSKAAIAWI